MGGDGDPNTAGLAISLLMDTYPDELALVQYHVSCAGSTPWGDARKSFYGVTHSPHVLFGGVLDFQGTLGSVAQQYAR